MIQEKRKGRKDEREKEREREEREERGEQGERLKGNINSQFHTYTHIHVKRTDYYVVASSPGTPDFFNVARKSGVPGDEATS